MVRKLRESTANRSQLTSRHLWNLIWVTNSVNPLVPQYQRGVAGATLLCTWELMLCREETEPTPGFGILAPVLGFSSCTGEMGKGKPQSRVGLHAAAPVRCLLNFSNDNVLESCLR